MNQPLAIPGHVPPAVRWRSRLSLATLAVAGAALAASFLLISPPPVGGYPGAIPWSPHSLLKPLTDALALGDALPTARGVEIKDVAFHLLVAVGLLLFAARAVISGVLPPNAQTARGAWLLAQILLIGWVLVSGASALWSGDAPISLAQAALYGFGVAWAIAISWSLEGRDVPRLLWTYVAVAAAAAGLCVWYYYERNPYHRPGFPIGNPNVLAAAIVPALLIGGFALAGALWSAWRRRSDVSWPAALAAAVALAPLAWCFALTGSRGAAVGAVLGVAGVLFLVVTRRARLLIVLGLTLMAAAGVWYLSSAMQDVTMARGATVRYRVYTWKYAAQLWSHRPISGMGAGIFPRAAGGLAVDDRVLDPGAFLGDKIGHAHNEFFEVFAEIGLVGGLTYVGGFVATLAAASGMLQSSFSRQRHALVLGLTAGVMALLGDSLFSPGLRLPGLAAVFYTLLGALWAVCRSTSRAATPAPPGSGWLRRSVGSRFGVAALAVAAAGGAGWLTAREVRGLRHELAAMLALHDGRFADAVRETEQAAPRLLEPNRVLQSRERRAVALSRQARASFAALASETDAAPMPGGNEAPVDPPEGLALPPDDRGGASPSAAPPPEPGLRRADVIADAQAAYEAALAFHDVAPGFGRAAALAGEAAEYLAHLHADDAQRSAAWRGRALQAWWAQSRLTPFDRPTLMARLRYPELLGDQIALLRDALRSGLPDAAWLRAFEQVARRPGFEATLNAMVRTVSAYTPESDRDALLLSRAPEIVRTRALWLHNQQRHAAAADDAAWAVELYRPLRPRLPELVSVALAEQAEYAFYATPHEPENAIRLATEALERLPRVQQQLYERRAAPYRLRLARYLIAADRVREATDQLAPLYDGDPARVERFFADTYVELLASLAARPPGQRGDVETWLARLRVLRPTDPSAWRWRCRLSAEKGPAEGAQAYRAARSAGVAPDALARIRAELCELFPETCALLAAP